MLVAHVVGAEKNGSREDASTGGVGRVEGWTSFLVKLIALLHALFSSAIIVLLRLEQPLCLYVTLQLLRRRWIK